VKRQATGGDWGLTVRMTCVGLLLAAYAAIALALVLLSFGTLLTLAMSRYREFAADRGSALIIGQPETLMSALTKLGEGTAIASGDLRAVGALCIIAAGARRTELLMDHPPLDKRLAKLAEIARELGTPLA
jgi:heat shock protein HtpX